MKKILFISLPQYGYLTDVFAYSKYLDKSKYEIHIVCYDLGLEKFELPGVAVHYIDTAKDKWYLNFKALRFLKLYIKLEKVYNRYKFDLVFVNYFRFCFLLRTFISRNSILDFRSGNLYDNSIKQISWNIFLRFETIFFKKISIITESLRKSLNLNEKKSFILPLGAEILDNGDKTFAALNLLYIGTFDKRNIENTIEGVRLFYNKFSGTVKITYDIIGYSDCELEKKIINQIKNNELENIITFHGRIPYVRLSDYISKCNIGVAYVPIVDYYQCQPLTKLFEYLFSGMPALATKTYENSRIINEVNGVLINEDAQSFCNGLELLHERLSTYNSEQIRATVMDYHWHEIVKNNLSLYLK